MMQYLRYSYTNLLRVVTWRGAAAAGMWCLHDEGSHTELCTVPMTGRKLRHGARAAPSRGFP